MKMELTGLKQKFEELFGKKDYTAFFAPGDRKSVV